MSLIPDVPAELAPHEISRQEWANLMGVEPEDFAAWYEDTIDFFDENETYSRPFAYGRIVAEWRSFARYLLEAIMQREPHPSHVFLYEQAQSHLLKAEAVEVLAEAEGFDLAAEYYPDEVKDAAKIASILANHDAIAAKLAQSAALSDSEADA
ncbi:hypothetical protein CIPOMA221M_12905 [Citrobacter portucalensis]|uniref:hypothetical protein n=1 Tax=Citrobacter portucalensis TaxID=1639133 RepID=UPI003B262B30